MNERMPLEPTVGINQEEILVQDLARLEEKNPAAAESIKRALAKAQEKKEQSKIVITKASMMDAKAVEYRDRRLLGDDY